MRTVDSGTAILADLDPLLTSCRPGRPWGTGNALSPPATDRYAASGTAMPWRPSAASRRLRKSEQT